MVHGVLDEDQVYRLDHFLGKEATQNLHVLRFTNAIIGDVWCNRGVAQVQIDVPETLDIDDRAAFYDATGATLDMVVTHLFQVAAEIAMEPPASLGAGRPARRPRVGDRLLPPARSGRGRARPVRRLPRRRGRRRRLRTDTFIAARLWVDTDRWRGVPFLLRTGKRLAVSEQRVTLALTRPPDDLVDDPPPTAISLSLKGSGELDITVVTKRPGPDIAFSSRGAPLPLIRERRARISRRTRP